MNEPKQDVFTNAMADYLWEQSTPPPLLWHYTGADGLLGIANGRSLWCTEYRHLNDKMEIATFAVNLIDRLPEELRGHFAADDIGRIVRSVTALYNTWNVFVCSFCTDPDRNEHWHQYAGRAGYALGFDTHVLRSLAQSQKFALGPVIYGEDRALDIAGAVVRDNLHNLEGLSSPLNETDFTNVVNLLCRLILGYAPFFKPGSFHRESEWRLVRVTGIGGDGKIQFRAKSPFGLLGYFRFNFELPSEDQPGTPRPCPNNLIPEMITGPGNETDGWLRSGHAYELLAQNGLETLVSDTKSSLRF